MDSKLKIFFELTTPHYLIFYIFGTIFSATIMTRGLNLFPLLLPIFSLSITILGLNTINMIFDSNLDKINKPKRPIPSGRIRKTTAFVIAILLCLIGILASVFSSFYQFVLVLGLIGFFLLYTNPKTYLKKYFWASPIFGGIFYGIIPYLAAWTPQKIEFNTVFFLFYVLLIACIAPIKDIEDMVGEKKHGIKSIPQLMGAKNTIKIIFASIIVLLTAVNLLSAAEVINKNYLIAGAISYTILAFIGLKFATNLDLKKDKLITQSKLVSVMMLCSILIYATYATISLI